ncbi:YbdD/YjiX family protein [Cellulomonas fimi]|uniref:YbdD/YjiX family protein n=1 Tax=Cellulomonas fimi TaxID=1708 RepID=UPI00235A376A|nr:YbdD/YjiX family protein [Cellulomonas fimi]
MTGRRAALAGRSTAHAVVRAARAVHWYTTTLLGDRDYDRYVAHLARAHPGVVPPSEAQYWRTRHAEADARPGARCC